jgi:Aspartyl protease
MYVPVTIDGLGTTYKTEALFDTGGTFSLALAKDDPFRLGMGAHLPKLGETRTLGANGESSLAHIVQLPQLEIANHRLKNVPAMIAQETLHGPGLTVNILGNDFLHRFDVILDLQAGHVYLRPNKHLNDAYGMPPDVFKIGLVAAVLLLLVVAGLWFWRRRRKRRLGLA